MEIQFIFWNFWIIQILSFESLELIAAHEVAVNSFTNVTEEKQVEWFFYSDDFRLMDTFRSYSTFGVALKKTLAFSNDLDNYNYEEENKQVQFVRSCRNLTSFYEALHQISDFEGKFDNSKLWKPYFFVSWPGVLNNETEAAALFLYRIILSSYSQNLTVETNLYVVIPVRNGSKVSYTLWEAYTVNNLTVYHKLLALDWYIQTNKMGRRENLLGAPVRVMTADDPNYEIVAKFKKKVGPPEFESGTAVSLLKYMKDRLNFSISAVKGNWTFENAEGNLAGGVLEMEQNIADLCISQTPMTPLREKHIHFLQPTYLDGLRAYFIQPPASQYRDIYYKSFEPNVWISLLGIWIIILAAMHGFAWIKNRYADIEVLDTEILDESLLWALGAACQQGWFKQPTSFSIRLVFFIGYLTGLVCFVAFSASIVSSLSVKSNPMQTFQDLVNANFKMYVQEGSTALVFLNDFLKSQEKHFKYVVNDSSVAAAYLLESKYSLVDYPDGFNLLTAPRFNPEFLCKTFTSLPVNKGPVQSAMMVQKGSPFTESFNYQIIGMLERGINDRFFVEFVRGTHAKCLDFSTGNTRTLEMIDVQTAFVILGIGYFLSMAVLGVEKTYEVFGKTTCRISTGLI